MMSHGVQATEMIERIGINIVVGQRGHTRGRYKSLNEILITVTLVNTSFVGVGWSGLFQNRLQQNGFHNFYFLLMKARSFQINFSDLVTFLFCSDSFGIKIFPN
jgi:hypothetical protein